MSTDPTRHRPQTYEQWIETYALDWADLDMPNPGTCTTRARRRAARREELTRP